MTGTLLILNYFYLLSILINSGAHGVKIQAYRHNNFTRLAWESSSASACHNIPDDKSIFVHSIITDTCFIAYTDRNCTSTWSQKFMPGEKALKYPNLGMIYSLHICNEVEGGNRLNLDITNFNMRKSFVLDPPNVLESYKNVCSCVNVPQYIQNMSGWSINNHHNSLLAYYEPNCTEQRLSSTFIAAGHNRQSREVHVYKKTDSVTNKTYKYQSFGPDPNSLYFQIGCKLDAVANNYAELQNLLDRSNQRQDELERVMKSLLKQHNDDVNYLSHNITQLNQENTNFTAKIRSDLRKVFF